MIDLLCILHNTGGVLALAADATEHGDGNVRGIVRATIALIAVASGVGVLTKLVRIPYTVALVLAGLGLALLHTPISGIHITEELVLLIFLPPLLFQAALHLDLGELRRQWVAVAALAVPGVVLTTGAAAAAIYWLLPNAVPHEDANWVTALVLGAVVAPTDPISVVAIFRSLGVPQRLRLLVEGEALFNDGTAAALFGVLKVAVVAAAVLGPAAGVAATPSVGGVAMAFAQATGIGLVVGAVLGTITFFVLRHLNDHTLETGITVALTWGSFLVAESVHGSGVIAVIVAGLLIGNYGKALAMSENTQRTLTGFWDAVDFIVNSVVFLLVGLELSDPKLGGVERLVSKQVLIGGAAVYGALLAARAVKVLIVRSVSPNRWPRDWNWVIWWAGLRGGLSLALTMGLPPGPVREYLLPIVFLIVLATLILQATSMPWIIRWSGASGLPEKD